MGDDDHTVPRDAGVEFERGDAERQRGGEGGQGVLRGKAPRTAVTLEVEGVRPYGEGGQRGEAESPDDGR